jgi:hypothetical protein
MQLRLGVCGADTPLSVAKVCVLTPQATDWASSRRNKTKIFSWYTNRWSLVSVNPCVVVLHFIGAVVSEKPMTRPGFQPWYNVVTIALWTSILSPLSLQACLPCLILLGVVRCRCFGGELSGILPIIHCLRRIAYWCNLMICNRTNPCDF